MNLSNLNVMIMVNSYFPFSFDGGKKYSGVEQVAENQYNLLKNVCKSVKVMCTRDSVDERRQDDILHYDFYSKLYTKNLGKKTPQKIDYEHLYQQIEENEIDIILYDVTKNRKLIQWLSDLSVKTRIPVIFYNHSLTEEGRIAWDRNLGFQYAVQHGCLVVSPTRFARDVINKQVEGCCNYNALYGYIPESTFSSSQERNGKIISASRIAPEMKLAPFVMAFQKSERDCEIYGNTNPEYQDYYDENVKPYLTDKVAYKGNVPHNEVLNIFCQSSLLAHSRDCESASLIIPEAIACGLPCLILDTNKGAKDTCKCIGIDLSDLYIDIRRMRKERASEVIKDKIEYFFSSKYNSREYREYISKTAREYFNTDNSTRRLVETIEAAYQLRK